MNSHNNQSMEGGLVEEAVHVEIEIEDRIEGLDLARERRSRAGRGDPRKARDRRGFPFLRARVATSRSSITIAAASTSAWSLTAVTR